MRYFSLLFFSCLSFLFAMQAVAAPTENNKLLVGYFQSWSEQWVSQSTLKQSQLVQTPAYVNLILLSFMQPEAQYKPGSFDLNGTGLQFPYDGKTLKYVIDAFKQSHPNSKLLVAVGGATYTNWDKVNIPAIAAFINDYQLDGVDIDFEPAANCSKGSDQHVHCQSDQQYIQLINDFRSAMPRPLWLSTAGWSIGAYGEDQWQQSQPQGDHTGMMLAVMRNVGDQIDVINIMSYDAGNKTTTGYDPVEALTAYQHYYHGKITLGIEVPPEAWGGNVTTLSEADRLIQAVNQQQAAGLMLWSLQKMPNGTPSSQNPDAKLLEQAICKGLQFSQC